MAPTLHLLGLTLDQQRSSAALSDEVAEAIHRRFASVHPDAGLLILNTTARLEFYVEATDRHTERILGVLDDVDGGQGPAIGPLGFHLIEDQTVGHLLRVGAGLESPILGDTQILEQLRHAQERSHRHDGLGPLLSEAVRRVLAHGGAVRRDTAIGAGGADIGSTVARTISEAGFTFAPVLLVGSGDAAARTLAAFEHAPRQVGIASDDRRQARELAARHDAALVEPLSAAGWSGAVIVLTDASVPEAVEPIVDGARLVIDVVPGGTRHRADVVLADLADWSDSRRLAAVPTVADRCDAALTDWQEWLRRRPFESAVGDLYRDVDRLVGTLDVGGAGPAVREMIRDWLDPHVAALRTAISPPTAGHSSVQESV